MPGANVATSDAFGMSNQVTMSVRGLNQQEIGFLVDGTPQNDTNSGTIFPSQLVDAENLQSASLSQGSSAIDTPVFVDLGGMVNYQTIDPDHKFGGYASAMFGTWNSKKEFIRVNTGDIGHTGIRGWMSFSNFHDQHFTGPGTDNRLHVDAKFLKEWGDGNRVAAVFTWAYQDISNYYEPTLQQWNQTGRSNYYSPTFVANGSPAANAQYWQLYRNPWEDINIGLPSTFRLAHNITANVEPYFWHGSGGGLSGTTLPTNSVYWGTSQVENASSLPNAVNGVAPVAQRYLNSPYRAGFVDKINITNGINKLTVGSWYEYDDFSNWVDYTPITTSGLPENGRGLAPAVMMSNGHPLRSEDYNIMTQVNGLFLTDRVSLLHDRLQISAGIKAMMVDRVGTSHIPGTTYRMHANSFQPLPRLGIHYTIDNRNQVFFNATTGFRPPLGESFFSSYSPATGAQTALGAGQQKDEYSIEEELGYRYQGRRIVGSVTLFNYNFTNRQVATQTYVGNLPVSTTINEGGQTTRGVDMEIGSAPIWHFSPYASFEYLHATLDNNFRVGNDYLPTKGKTAVESPHYQVSLGLTYDDGRIFGNFNLKYMSGQYATFMNDEKMPAQVHSDMTIGAYLPSVGFLKKPKFQLNFINLWDSHYLSGIAAVLPNANATRGMNGTSIASAGSPTYYIASGFTVAAQLSTGF
ncbi:TonB-dependent receptor [Komagataeibacter swingsii DSM 16373]|nr:TonB-dependent receptor [Komagataeibacter swingsii DSM 16373]